MKPQLMFSIVRSGGQFYFKVVATANGKTLAHSERYKQLGSARRAIKAMVKHIKADSYWVEEVK